MDNEGLTDVFVTAYRPYVLGRLELLGIDAPPGLVESLDEGEEWLRQALEELLATPYLEQRRGPLELFQEAMSFPTEVLRAAGVRPADRDPIAVSALPGDLFDLAPASSQSLGEEAWQAHLAWGAAKAAAVTSPARPGVRVVSANLLDRSRIESAVRAGGRSVATSATDPASLAVVDLAAPRAIEQIEDLARAGVRVIAFGPHVDAGALEAASAAGATESLPRSLFFRRLDEIVGG